MRTRLARGQLHEIERLSGGAAIGLRARWWSMRAPLARRRVAALHKEGR